MAIIYWNTHREKRNTAKKVRIGLKELLIGEIHNNGNGPTTERTITAGGAALGLKDSRVADLEGFRARWDKLTDEELDRVCDLECEIIDAIVAAGESAVAQACSALDDDIQYDVED